MRTAKLMLLAALAMGAPVAMADAPPTTVPSVVASAQVAPAAPSVLVLPFQQTGDTSSFGWIAPAVQEDLLGQIARLGALQPLSANQPVAGADTAAALQIARSNNANVVIFGGYQIVGDQLRIDGQALDVASGRIIGTLQANGAVTDLFKMEDALAAQVSQLLPAPPSQMPQVTYGTPDNSSMAPSVAAVPDNNYYAPPSGYNPYDYGYNYYPTYTYGYGYPYYYARPSSSIPAAFTAEDSTITTSTRDSSTPAPCTSAAPRRFKAVSVQVIHRSAPPPRSAVAASACPSVF